MLSPTIATSFRMDPLTPSWRRRLSAVMWISLLLLFNVTMTKAQAPTQEVSKRSVLDPIRISMSPINQELTYQEQLLIRYEMEQLLSDYLLNQHEWSSNTEVIYVALARILDYEPIQGGEEESAIVGARIALDGIVYYDDSSTDIPTSDDLLPLVETALEPSAVLSSLQTRFPSLTSTQVEADWTEAPTMSPPSPNPTIAPTTKAPTGRPTETPSVSPTARPTDAPTVRPTAAPTSSPTDTPSASPTSHPTVTPTSHPTLAPSTSEPTTSAPTEGTITATPSGTVVTTPAPSTATTEASDTSSPASEVDTFTASPSSLPSSSPPPRSVDGVVSGPTSLTASDRNLDSATIAGAAAGTLLAFLAGMLLLARHRRSSPGDTLGWKGSLDGYQEQLDEGAVTSGNRAIVKPGAISSTDHQGVDKDLGPSPAKTLASVDDSFDTDTNIKRYDTNTQEEEEEEKVADGTNKGLRFFTASSLYKSISKTLGGGGRDGNSNDDPPLMEMTDGSAAGDSDVDAISEGYSETGTDVSLGLDVGRGYWPTSRSTVSPSTTTGSNTGSISTGTVESFEQQRRQNQSHVLRKDLMESPDLSAATLSNYKTGQALSYNRMKRDDTSCALTPSDISAATLAMRPRKDNDDDDDDDEEAPRLGIHPPNPPRAEDDTELASVPEQHTQDEIQQESALFSASGLAGIFQSLWGNHKSPQQQQAQRLPPQRARSRLLSSGGDTTDDDTNGGSGDWDPDDETSASGRSSASSSIFDMKVPNRDDQSLLSHSKQESYKMQRLRTPPTPTRKEAREVTRPSRMHQLAPVAPQEGIPASSAYQSTSSPSDRGHNRRASHDPTPQAQLPTRRQPSWQGGRQPAAPSSTTRLPSKSVVQHYASPVESSDDEYTL